jgi:hypothetical protein
MARKISRFIGKITRSIHRLYSSISNLPLIKSLLGLIAIVYSYRIVKFIWYFNKAIIYVLGLVFVGFNWDDYNVLTEIKLAYNALKLYILSFFNPKTPIISKNVKNTIKDIDLILEAEKVSNLEKKVTYNEGPPTSKFIITRKTYTITDGKDNSWDLYDLIVNPWVIFAVATAITITGIVVVRHYDLSLDQITEYSWTHIKSGFIATVIFLNKVIKWFFSRGNSGGDGGGAMSPTGRIPTQNFLILYNL